VVYEYDEHGRVTRSLAVAEPEWTDADRGLVLALLAERAETCPSCGHLTSVCRDESTAGTWQVLEEVCQPSRVAQAVAEGVAEGKRRGVVLLTRRVNGSQHA
jgi:hypothetical protein